MAFLDDCDLPAHIFAAYFQFGSVSYRFVQIQVQLFAQPGCVAFAAVLPGIFEPVQVFGAVGAIGKRLADEFLRRGIPRAEITPIDFSRSR